MKPTIILTIAAMVAFSYASAEAMSFEMAETSSLTDKKPEKKKREVKEVTFAVHLHCDSCVKKVEENISFEKGVKDLKTSLEHQTVTLKYDPAKTSEEALKKAIEELGYPVSGTVKPGHVHHHDHVHTHQH